MFSKDRNARIQCGACDAAAAISGETTSGRSSSSASMPTAPAATVRLATSSDAAETMVAASSTAAAAGGGAATSAGAAAIDGATAVVGGAATGRQPRSRLYSCCRSSGMRVPRTSHTTPSFSVRVRGSRADGITAGGLALPNMAFRTVMKPTSESPRIPSTTKMMSPSMRLSSCLSSARKPT